uniref:Isochorismatase-like domain-containing protein n=1 Tax=Chlamydomonas leiostraca TaxID=1034604 RepID=A0A7S0S0R6_9CHLO|mmetsp:Transcript_37315/g.94100  ORF Transcript_37315/g.94100 Transcript_37315/m.94100 type:complete len:241 (+) Transcript_37315:126-848(+)
MTSYYNPTPHLREVPCVPSSTAILFIDTQNFNCHRAGAIYRHYSSEELEGPDFQYFFRRVADITPNWVRLQSACRASGVEVMYTVIQSLTSDGRDRSLDYRISGFHVAPGSWDAKVVEALRPGADEVVLPKTSSSVFNSTNIDFILRCMGKRHLILCGCVTDQCVAHAVMDACDLGYYVTLVPDACATYSQERHDAAVRAIGGYCRKRSTEELSVELGGNTGIAGGASAGGEAARVRSRL